MPNAAPLTLYRTVVPLEWVDYNGHMNDACYATAFSLASDALIDRIGMDADYRTRTGNSLFTVELHICYLSEAKRGEALHVTGQLVGRDAKRLRLFMALYRDADDALLATGEGMYLHVDTRGPKVTRFDDAIRGHVDALWAQHRDLPVPARAGRAIATLEDDLTRIEGP